MRKDLEAVLDERKQLDSMRALLSSAVRTTQLRRGAIVIEGGRPAAHPMAPPRQQQQQPIVFAGHSGSPGRNSTGRVAGGSASPATVRRGGRPLGTTRVQRGGARAHTRD